MKFGLMLKALSLLIVVVLLMIGMQMISGVAHERSQYREQAAASIRQSLAGPQTIAGPNVTRTCLETVESTTETAKGKVTEKTEQSRVLKSLPQSVKWTVASAIEPRYRGLYKVNSYRVDANAEVAWSSLEELVAPAVKSPAIAIRCADPKIEFAVNDPRGIRSIKLDWRDTSLRAQSLTTNDVFAAGFEAKPTLTESAFKESQQLRISMELVGVETLGFVPLGNENFVEMTSDWPHPSFAGAFLPAVRSVNQKGFQSKWSVSSLASNARAGILKGDAICTQMSAGGDEPTLGATRAVYAAKAAASNGNQSCLQSFGVSFVDPVNPATLADRATKYAFLFIALTFLGIVMLEVIKDIRVHPIHYLLIGAALAVFFLLLLSLSEHISFARAYVAASGACIALIGVYAKSVFGNATRALATMAGLCVLYAVLYVVLQSEQHALLAGSLLIFAAIASVMLLTRRVNWGALGAKVAANAGSVSSATREINSAEATMQTKAQAV